MIFLTVGTQLHFDRLVEAVDQFLETRKGLEIFAQISDSKYRPRNMQFRDFLDPAEFDQYFARATHIIGHAGMGTIIQSLLRRKPILIMPRKAALGEQRNDHQLATAKRFRNRQGVLVADDETQISRKLDELMSLANSEPISEFANPQLIEWVSTFITE